MPLGTEGAEGAEGAIKIANYIDHTLLRPEATRPEFARLCDEALEYNFHSICVPPHMVTFARQALKNSAVKVCTVVGFPFGYNITATKAFEAKRAVDQGAHEIDMVLNISALKSGEAQLVQDDIQTVVHAAQGRLVKVIFETGYLSAQEIRLAGELSLAAGANFFKTSTGFGSRGASAEDVSLLVDIAQGRVGVKASGGIRDTAAALKMISLGATRLGTSNSVAIVGGQGSTVGRPANNNSKAEKKSTAKD